MTAADQPSACEPGTPGIANDVLSRVLTYMLAICVCGIFYIHTFLDLPTKFTTPATMGVAMVLLFALCIDAARKNTFWRVPSALRMGSASFFYLAILLGGISTLHAAFKRALDVRDWGVAFVQLFLPVILTFLPTRVSLIRSMVFIALLFSFLDFGANVLTLMGVGDFTKHLGEGTYYGEHWLGIPGSSFAEGLTAFFALCGLGFEIGRRRLSGAARHVPLAVALIVSLWMIRARTEFLASIVAAVTLAVRRLARFPLFILSVSISSMLLIATFFGNPYGTDESLRSYLLTDGFYKALTHPFIGDGPSYKDTTTEIANYRILSDLGITESGILDWAIAYGVPSAICLFIGIYLVLLEWRYKPTLPAVIVAVLSGIMVLSGDLLPMVTTIAFYASLICCQREEFILLKMKSREI